LARVGPEAKAAVPALTQALEDRSPLVRMNAAYALGKIGPAARAAAGALLEARKDKAPRVRQAASWAVLQVDPRAARRAAVEEPLPLYNASLGNSARGFDREDLGVGSEGRETADRFVLWVNGDPVAVCGTDELRELHLNPWLRPG